MVTDKDLAWLRESIERNEREAKAGGWPEHRRTMFADKAETLRRIEAALLAQKQEPVRYLVTSEIPAKGSFHGSNGWVVVKEEDDAKSRCETIRAAGAIATVVPLYDAPPAPAVAVKALEWVGDYGESKVCGTLCYRIAYNASGGPWGYPKRGAGYYAERDTALGSLVDGPFEYPEEAKAAAQADYERRILSALTTQQPNEGNS